MTISSEIRKRIEKLKDLLNGSTEETTIVFKKAGTGFLNELMDNLETDNIEETIAAALNWINYCDEMIDLGWRCQFVKDGEEPIDAVPIVKKENADEKTTEGAKEQSTVVVG